MIKKPTPPTNIWESLDLSEDKLKTAYDYLIPQSENFKIATKGLLTMEIEVKREISTDAAKREMTLYYLFIIAPYLGKFRKQILHVAEFDDQGRFPVNIWCYPNNQMFKDVTEENFLLVVKDILAKKEVKNSIESLYRQSIDAKRNSSK